VTISDLRVRDARDNLNVFAAVAGQPLELFQFEALQLRKRMTVLVGGRQLGKSTSLAMVALHRAFRSPRQVVLIVSASDGSAKATLAKVREIAADSPLLSGSVIDEQASKVTLSNGSVIRSVPASERAIRGPSSDLLIIDEAAQVAAIDGGRLITAAALPTTMARPDARVILASSPLGRSGYFYEQAMAGERGADTVETFRWRLSQAPWVTAEVIASLREQIPDPLLQRAELDGEFVDLDGGHRLIARPLIDAAVDRVLQRPKHGVVGVDVARFGGDRTVGYLNAGGVVRRAFEGRGWDTGRTAGAVAGAVRSPDAGELVAVIDDNGVGGGVTDQARALGLSVVAFIGSSRASQPTRFANRRAESFWRMRTAFEDGVVDLDATDRDLVSQLEDLVYEYDDRGHIRMEGKDSMRSRGVRSPDHADALSMTFAVESWRPPPQWAMSEADELAAEIARIRRAELEAARRAETAEGFFSRTGPGFERGMARRGLQW
jgi:hypothetical protein